MAMSPSASKTLELSKAYANNCRFTFPEAQASICLITIPESKHLPFSILIISFFGRENLHSLPREFVWKVKADASVYSGDYELIRTDLCG